VGVVPAFPVALIINKPAKSVIFGDSTLASSAERRSYKKEKYLKM